jgi:hypothetical protein
VGPPVKPEDDKRVKPEDDRRERPEDDRRERPEDDRGSGKSIPVVNILRANTPIAAEGYLISGSLRELFST